MLLISHCNTKYFTILFKLPRPINQPKSHILHKHLQTEQIGFSIQQYFFVSASFNSFQLRAKTNTHAGDFNRLNSLLILFYLPVLFVIILPFSSSASRSLVSNIILRVIILFTFTLVARLYLFFAVCLIFILRVNLSY